MKHLSILSLMGVAIVSASVFLTAPLAAPVTAQTQTSISDSATAALPLGQFSVSLSVKDLQTSIDFYTRLGFTQVAGEPANNWIILQNGLATIGLFQGMFEGNYLTFNPTDVRAIQSRLKQSGVAIATEADTTTTGAAYIFLNDPDGNVILMDQF